MLAKKVIIVLANKKNELKGLQKLSMFGVAPAPPRITRMFVIRLPLTADWPQEVKNQGFSFNEVHKTRFSFFHQSNPRSRRIQLSPRLSSCARIMCTVTAFDDDVLTRPLVYGRDIVRVSL